MRTSTIIAICSSLGVLVGCDLLKHNKAQEGQEASSQGTNGSTAPAANNGSTKPADNAQNQLQEQSANDPSKGAVTGCGWPTDGSKNATITKGCQVAVKSNLDIEDGATLTIEEGVKLSFDTDTGIFVTYGKLVVQGTADKPVLFTSSNTSPAAGDWWGVHFKEKTGAGTSIDHAIFEYTGSESAGGQGAILVDDMRQGGRISITNTTFRTGSQFGVVAGDNATFGKFENNTFKDNKKGSMRAKAEVLGSVGRGNTFTQPIQVTDSEIDQSTTWPAFDVPLVVDGNITIGSDSSIPTLTIADKTVLKMGQDRFIRVGDGDKPGALVAKNVTFTSASPSPGEGDWVGLILRQKIAGTDIENCTFEYFGSGTAGGEGAITLWGFSAKDMRGATIANNTFRKGKPQAMHSDDHDCADFPKKNKAEGLPFCNKN